MHAIDLTTAETLVPPIRLGTLLRERREASDLALADLARANDEFSIVDLGRIERGEVALADEDVRAIAAVYGLDLDGLSGSRAMLEIDRSEGRLAIGDQGERFRPADDDRRILLRYLALVYRIRDVEPGQVLPARAGDLAVLATVFGTSPEEVRRSLEDLMVHGVGDLRHRHAELKRRVIVPAVGALVALTSIGGILLTNQLSHAAPVRIGTPLVLVRGTAVGPNIGEPLTITSDGSSTRAPGAAIGPNIGDALTIDR